MRFFNEIKRRHVHRMVVLYAVVAWLIMQVTEVVKDLANLPDWVGPAVLGLLATGFPIALIFSWFYELTPEGVALEEDIAKSGSTTSVSSRRVNFVVISLLCAAVLMFAYDKWWTRELSVTSLAVLPIKAISTDVELGYLAEGITEVLIGELGRIKGLRVTSRTSASRYKSTDKLLPDIASELGVDALLEGSMQQTNGKLRVNLHLIDGRADRQLWAGNFDRDYVDILALQGEVVRSIADEIRLSLSTESQAQAARRQPSSPEALRFWAIGNHHLKALKPESFTIAMQAFNQAIEIDPGFAPAYAGIAQAYAYMQSWHGRERPLLHLESAKAAAQSAISLDPEQADAYFALGMIHSFQWQWEAAEQAYRKAWELNPSDTTGLLWFANFMAAMGRMDEAMEIARYAVEIDPFSPAILNELGAMSFYTGDPEAALKYYETSLHLEPGFHQTLWMLAEYYINVEEYDEAAQYLDRFMENLDSAPATITALVGGLYLMLGNEDDARHILHVLLERREITYAQPMAFVYLYDYFGEHEPALHWLEVAYREHDPALMWLKAEAEGAFQELQDYPRFRKILDRLDFPDSN